MTIWLLFALMVIVVFLIYKIRNTSIVKWYYGLIANIGTGIMPVTAVCALYFSCNSSTSYFKFLEGASSEQLAIGLIYGVILGILTTPLLFWLLFKIISLPKLS